MTALTAAQRERLIGCLRLFGRPGTTGERDAAYGHVRNRFPTVGVRADVADIAGPGRAIQVSGTVRSRAETRSRLTSRRQRLPVCGRRFKLSRDCRRSNGPF